MSSSGGLIYHLRALRSNGEESSALWSGHREGVNCFLNRWNPPEKTLFLIGPSGGYSLPEAFLKRFDHIIAAEPDWLARRIFEKRFSVKPVWIKSGFDFNRIEKIAEIVPPGSAILFSNLLGQISFSRTGELKKKLKQALEPYSWASYHDALSGENLEFDTELAEPLRQAPLSKMKSWIYPKIKGGTLEINAHQAPDLFSADPGNQFHYWQWRITPKRTHLIEGVFHVKT